MEYRGTTCLVTGASSGIGVEFATRFAERGADVVLVARRRDRLEELADRLSAAYGVQAVPLACDLAEPGAAGRLVAELDDAGIQVDTLVNNAGFSTFGPLIESDPGRESDQVAVNVAAVVDLTRHLLPGLVASGRGALVNLASIAAYQPLPVQAVYGASKAFVLSFTEALAYETRGTGLRVLALCPGPVDTEFFDVSDHRAAGGRHRQNPVELVDAALRSLDRRRTPPSVIPGTWNRVQSVIMQRLPRRWALELAGRRG